MLFNEFSRLARHNTSVEFQIQTWAASYFEARTSFSLNNLSRPCPKIANRAILLEFRNLARDVTQTHTTDYDSISDTDGKLLSDLTAYCTYTEIEQRT